MMKSIIVFCVVLTILKIVSVTAVAVAAEDCGNCGACGPTIPGIQFPNPNGEPASGFQVLNGISTVDDCCASCTDAVAWPGSNVNGNITCNAWSYQSSTQTCYLIFGYPQTPANRAYYEGNEYVGVINPASPGTCTVVGSSQGPIGSHSLDFANYDIYNTPTATTEECCQLCLTVPGCVVFSWTATVSGNPNSPNCWTKGYAIVDPTWTSGFNANIGGTAPCADTTYVSPTALSATATSNTNVVGISYNCPGNLGCPGVNDPGYTVSQQ
jgi:hypothetical protein